jgi:hypothetical protein
MSKYLRMFAKFLLVMRETTGEVDAAFMAMS